MLPVIFAVDGNRAGMMLRMSCTRRDASRDRIGVAGILTNDGRECVGRDNRVAKNLSLVASRENWGRENFWSPMVSREKVGREKLQSLMDVVALKKNYYPGS